MWPKQKKNPCGSNLLLLTGHPSDSPRLNTFDSTAEKNEFLLSCLPSPKRSLFWQSCWRYSPSTARHQKPKLKQKKKGPPCMDHVRISRFPFCIVRCCSRASENLPNLIRWSSHDGFPSLLLAIIVSFPSCFFFFLSSPYKRKQDFTCRSRIKRNQNEWASTINSSSLYTLRDDWIDKARRWHNTVTRMTHRFDIIVNLYLRNVNATGKRRQ